MAPKKAKTKAKTKSKRATASASTLGAQDTADRLALIEQAKEMRLLIKSEESAFNDFQQQRERINYFWIVERKNLEERTAQLRNKERERQEMEEKYQFEIKVTIWSNSLALSSDSASELWTAHKAFATRAASRDQWNEARYWCLRVCWECESLINCFWRLEGELSLQTTQDAHRDTKHEIKSDNRHLQAEGNMSDIAHYQYMKSLKHEQDEKLSNLRHQYERYAKDIQQKYERKRKVRRLLQLRRV